VDVARTAAAIAKSFANHRANMARHSPEFGETFSTNCPDTSGQLLGNCPDDSPDAARTLLV